MSKKMLLNAAAFVVVSSLLFAASAAPAQPVKTRKSEITYAFEVTGIPEGARSVRVWVPFPTDTAEQRIYDMRVNSPFPFEINYDKVWGNAIIYFKGEPRDFTFEMKFRVERREARSEDLGKIRNATAADRRLFAKYLAPSRLAVRDERVERLSRMAVDGRSDPLEKARAIYDFVLEKMDYDKKTPGWGRGDVKRVCLSIGARGKGTGNCTDFHSFFSSLMQAQGIPVVFEMGYPLAPGGEQREPKEGGYHCWARFYIPEAGWVPVDISEADKDPSRRDYFFGSLCENRIRFSRGRDIVLMPPQDGEPLNYFGPDPYIEVDGKPFNGFKRTIAYTNERERL
ncbi:MAG TPA: transglutaminase domain-containing protein [Deltaproteobacteria bacterium]|nr:transglutaminase domain-containing protein [Deltaproteobacteria bacterium]